MDASPLINKILPRRNAAAQASTNILEQLGDSDSEGNDFGESPKGKGSVSVKYGRVKGRRTQTMDTPSPTKRNVSKKKPLRRKSLPVSKKHPRTPSVGNSDEEDSEKVFMRPISVAKQRQSGKPFLDVPKLSGSSSTEIDAAEPHWTISNIIGYVWVLINLQSRVFNPSDEKEDDEWIWWPGKIESSSTPMKVQFYGTTPGRRVTSVPIKNPSSKNIIPHLNYLGRDRFSPDAPPFIGAVTSTTTSPRKKQKRDLSSLFDNWRHAQRSLMLEKENDDDGLPDVAFAFSSSAIALSSSQTPRSDKASRRRIDTGNKGKGKGKAANNGPESVSDGDLALEDDSDIFDDGPDMLLTIPDELCLARPPKAKSREHWPAKLLNYIPPTKTSPPLYSFICLDNAKISITRDRFYASYQPEFGTCMLGQFDSQVVDDEDDEAEDNDGISVHSEQEDSPEPIVPPPSSQDFIHLSIREQFCYTKPVLHAVVCNEYGPMRVKRDKFFKGPSSRAALSKEAGLRGSVDTHDVARLAEYVQGWCLRSERHGIRFDGPDVDDRTMAPIPRGPIVGGTVEEIGNVVMVPSSSEKDAIMDIKPSAQAENVEAAVEMGDLNTTSNQKAEVTAAGPSPAEGDIGSTKMGDPTVASNNEETKTTTTAEPSLATEIETAKSSSPSPTTVVEASSPSAVPPPTSFYSEAMDINSSPLTEIASLPDLESVTPTVPETVRSTVSEENASTKDAVNLVKSENASVHRPRLTGCVKYERLAPVERMQFCLDVLLPEAITQILLWRSGDRTSVDLLSPEEEQEKHDKGEQLRKETDWVFDVIRLRRAVERQLKAKEGPESIQIGGTSTRPRRANTTKR